MPQDATGKSIKVGDKVRFQSQEWTIDRFIPAELHMCLQDGQGQGEWTGGTSVIQFVEVQHITKNADVISA